MISATERKVNGIYFYFLAWNIAEFDITSLTCTFRVEVERMSEGKLHGGKQIWVAQQVAAPSPQTVVMGTAVVFTVLNL